MQKTLNTPFITTVSADDIRAWRSRSGQELYALRARLNAMQPVLVHVSDEQHSDAPQVVISPEQEDEAASLTVMYPVAPDGSTVAAYIFLVEDYPCIAAHVAHCGDTEFLNLLEGIVSPANMSDHTVWEGLPQEWLDACIDIAELTAPPLATR